MNEVAHAPLAPSDAHSFAFRSKLPWPIWALYRVVRVPAVASAFASFWLGAVLLAWMVLPVAAFGGREARVDPLPATSLETMIERAASIEAACKWIDAGFDILVFPEGMRSPPGSIHRFHRGAFAIAKRAQVPLIPLLLTCRPSALTKGRPFWLHPDQCAILSVEPKTAIIMESRTNSRNLRGEVENMYREWMGLGPTS